MSVFKKFLDIFKKDEDKSKETETLEEIQESEASEEEILKELEDGYLEEELEKDLPELEDIDDIEVLEEEATSAPKKLEEMKPIASETEVAKEDKASEAGMKNASKIEEIVEEAEKIEDIEELVDIESLDEAEDFEDLQEFQEEIEEEADAPVEKFSLFKRLKEGLSKTKQGITGKIENLIKSYQKVDEELLEELEEILITADLGVQTTMDIMDSIRVSIKKQNIKEPEGVKELLKEKLKEILEELSADEKLNVEPSPAIMLVVGVNGVGKTTSIGKIAYKLKKQGKKVLLAAGDTFRAAASDQLKIWGDRVGVEVIRHQEGADPGAVIFDAIAAAKARKADVLICDTAGRLHNKKNLMSELGKIFKIVDREYGEATKEVLLVLDATTGQNAIQQAKVFKEVADITGLVLTKLDGTAKGGVVIAISSELKIPVKLIGVGEKMEDLQEFEAKTFVEALFGE